MPVRLSLIVGALALAMPVSASAGDVLLKVGEPLARADMLKPGVQRYVRYTVSKGERRLIDIWTRTTSFEEKDGKRFVRIRQQWDQASEKGLYLSQDSLFEAGTMRPVTHVRAVTKAGTTQTGAYRFDGATVTDIPDYPNNQRKDFKVVAKEPAYNFETDIEFFRQLPLAPGYGFTATFYGPGQAPPDRFTFRVAGSDTLAGPDGKPLDCWVLTSDYNQPEKPLAKYWIAKRNQVLVKQEAILDGGDRIVKTLVANESTDAQG